MKFILVKNPRPKKATMIIGFPGIGLVGSISLSFLSEQGDFELIGYIKSKSFAPIAAIHRYKPLPPARIYYSKSKSIFLVFSEIVIPIESASEFVDKLLDFAKSHNIKKIISLGGISLRKKKNAVYLLTNKENSKYYQHFEKIKEGATTGVVGELLSRSVFEKYEVLSLLAEANPDFIDPRAASLALKKLSLLVDLDIKTKELDDDASKLRKINKAIVKTSQENAMYG